MMRAAAKGSLVIGQARGGAARDQKAARPLGPAQRLCATRAQEFKLFYFSPGIRAGRPRSSPREVAAFRFAGQTRTQENVNVASGSIVWGRIASFEGVPAAYFAAATGAILAVPLTWRWKLVPPGSCDPEPDVSVKPATSSQLY